VRKKGSFVKSARLSYLLNSTFALFSVSGCAGRDFGSDVNPNSYDVSEAAQIVSSSSNGELQFSVASTWLKLSPSDSSALALWQVFGWFRVSFATSRLRGF
jgi:hypothetical protein